MQVKERRALTAAQQAGSAAVNLYKTLDKTHAGVSGSGLVLMFAWRR
jgi:hypothetical protein